MMLRAKKRFVRVRGWMSFVSSALLVGLLASFGSAEAQAHEKLSDKPLVYCAQGAPVSFDPGTVTRAIDFMAARPLYNNLIEHAPGSSFVEFQPALATSWDISQDQLTYTFHLRHGVHFHSTSYFTPTRDFNADDVIFTFTRMYDTKAPINATANTPNVYAYYPSMGFENIESITKTDDYTVVFKLKNPMSPFLSDLAMGFASILSKEYADQLVKEGHPENLGQYPIGTGPFKFKAYSSNELTRYVRFEQYWNREKIKLPGLIFVMATTNPLRLERLRRNECQLGLITGPEALKSAERVRDIKIMSTNAYSQLNIDFNIKKEPFTDPRVRRALAMALDREQIAKIEFHDMASVAHGFAPENLFGYGPTRPIAYNIERAKKLLARAGYPHGFTVPFWVPEGSGFIPNANLLFTKIQAAWAKIGVRIYAQTLDLGAYFAKAGQGLHHVIFGGWQSDNGDPDDWFYTLYGCNHHGTNLTFYCNKKFDRLMLQAQRISDPVERKRLYARGQRMLRRDMPAIPFVYIKSFVAMRRNVKGVVLDPLANLYFRDMWLEEK